MAKIGRHFRFFLARKPIVKKVEFRTPRPIMTAAASTCMFRFAAVILGQNVRNHLHNACVDDYATLIL